MITCRHLAAAFVSNKADKVDVGSVFSEEKLQSGGKEFSQGAFLSYVGSAKKEIIRCDELGAWLAAQAQQLAPGLVARPRISRHVLLSTACHAMALTLEVKALPEGDQASRHRYVVRFFDPNETNVYRRAAWQDLESLRQCTLDELFSGGEDDRKKLSAYLEGGVGQGAILVATSDDGKAPAFESLVTCQSVIARLRIALMYSHALEIDKIADEIKSKSILYPSELRGVLATGLDKEDLSGKLFSLATALFITECPNAIRAYAKLLMMAFPNGAAQEEDAKVLDKATGAGVSRYMGARPSKSIELYRDLLKDLSVSAGMWRAAALSKPASGSPCALSYMLHDDYVSPNLEQYVNLLRDALPHLDSATRRELIDARCADGRFGLCRVLETNNMSALQTYVRVIKAIGATRDELKEIFQACDAQVAQHGAALNDAMRGYRALRAPNDVAKVPVSSQRLDNACHDVRRLESVVRDAEPVSKKKRRDIEGTEINCLDSSHAGK